MSYFKDRYVCMLSCVSDSLRPYDHSLPGCSVHEILHARILEWVTMSSSRDLPDPRIEPVSLMSPALAGRFFTTRTTWKALFQRH